jgi:murein DD-endopeptidase MepM/ murein hydrolase activator NlpD
MSGWLVKIIPPAGYSVWRFEFTPLKVFAIVLLLGCPVGGASAYGVAHWRELLALTADQQERLTKIDAEADQLDEQLRSIHDQNRQIRSIIGASDGNKGAQAKNPPESGDSVRQKTRADEFSSVEDRLRRLREDSDIMRSESSQLRQVTLHILNVRHLQAAARSRAIAAIPSISPVGRVEITSHFGFRYSPWPEFHRGLDMAANYGDAVHATAAGTVVAAGYQGGWGYKIDIDHGNGYHTWYAHLSRLDVTVGKRVAKGERIAAVGSTGASTGSHLHYQVMRDGEAVDPQPFLAGVPPKILATLPH